MVEEENHIDQSIGMYVVPTISDGDILSRLRGQSETSQRHGRGQHRRTRVEDTELRQRIEEYNTWEPGNALKATLFVRLSVTFTCLQTDYTCFSCLFILLNIFQSIIPQIFHRNHIFVN